MLDNAVQYQPQVDQVAGDAKAVRNLFIMKRKELEEAVDLPGEDAILPVVESDEDDGLDDDDDQDGIDEYTDDGEDIANPFSEKLEVAELENNPRAPKRMQMLTSLPDMDEGSRYATSSPASLSMLSRRRK